MKFVFLLLDIKKTTFLLKFLKSRGSLAPSTPLRRPWCHWHCTGARFTVLVSCTDEIVVHSCPLLCLQGQVAKLASGLFHYWSLLRNNYTTRNLQNSLQVTAVGVFPHVIRAPTAGFSQWRGQPKMFWGVKKFGGGKWLVNSCSLKLKKKIKFGVFLRWRDDWGMFCSYFDDVTVRSSEPILWLTVWLDYRL